MVLFGSLISACFELIGVMLIFPLMSLVIRPELALSTPTLAHVHRLLGSPRPEIFVLIASIGVAVIYILKAGFQIGFLRLEHRTLARWKIDICQRFFQRYLEVNYQFHLQRSSSQLINTIVGEIPAVMNNGIHHAVLLTSYSIVSLALIFFLSLQYTTVTIAVFIVFSALFFVQARLIKRRVILLGEKTSNLGRENYAALQQGIAAYKETKIGLRERFFCNVFGRANAATTRNEEKLLYFQNLPLATTELIVILTLIMAFDLLLMTPDRRDWVTVDLAVLVMVVFRMVPMVNRALNSVTQIQSVRVLMRKLVTEAQIIGYEKAVKPDEIPDDTTLDPLEMTRTLRLEHVSYTYPEASTPALEDVSLTIKRGEFVGIIGTSGAGKTTLMGVLLGFLPPQEGVYSLDNTPITPDNLRSLRWTIGYVDQQTFIFEGSVMENVAFGTAIQDIDRSRVEEALRQAELWDFVCSLDGGMESSVGENGKRLSGGQRQRLAIARALYKRPTILILDEATSALDVGTEHRISETIRNLRGKLTIIAIAHRLSTLKAADRLVIMQNGHVLQEAPYDVLLEDSPLFQDLVRMSQLVDERQD